MSGNIQKIGVYPALGRSLAFYTLCHFLVDTMCYYYMFGSLLPALRYQNRAVLVIPALILYNLFAFGLQPLWGLVADRFPQLPTGLLGMILLVLGFVPRVLVPLRLPVWLLFIILMIVGIGNAAFHVEGGRDSLVRSGGNELRTGVFAAGGAAGVMVGMAIAPFGVALYILLILWAVSLPTLIWLRYEAKRSLFFSEIPQFVQFPTLTMKRDAKQGVVMASFFLLLQTMTLPTLSLLRGGPYQVHGEFWFSWIFPVGLALILVGSRPLGGWLTSRVHVFPFLLGSWLLSLLPIIFQLYSPWLLLLSGFILAAPSAWAAYRYYYLLPHRPAFAYSLQKIPMFIASFVVLSRQAIYGVPSLIGSSLEIIISVVWLSLFIFGLVKHLKFYIYRRKVLHE
ncbi:MAG TPA: MFS transporter [Clostridiaceae bacterium]|nr:MFS transporter [Clostridiaceae bacterium]